MHWHLGLMLCLLLGLLLELLLKLLLGLLLSNVWGTWVPASPWMKSWLKGCAGLYHSDMRGLLLL